MTEMIKYKAEAFDIMQYFYRRAHDPVIHGVIEFSGHLDEAILKKATTASMDTIPLICCSFDVSGKHPFWKNNNFTAEDIVKLVNVDDDYENQKASLLASIIDIYNEPQLKLYIVRRQEADSLYILMNHMVCDGSGFKDYIYLLGNLYAKLSENKNIDNEKSSASRGTSQLFSSFSLGQKLHILLSKYDISKQKNQPTYCLDGDQRNAVFERIQIQKREFDAVNAYARLNQTTINNIIICAYIREFYKETGVCRIILPCPVDLRKYIKPDGKHRICNLTSNFICDITMNMDDTFENTLSEVTRQMMLQKKSNNCLKSVIMLETIFKVLSFRILDKKFEKFFTIPVLSYTNLGIIDKSKFHFGNVQINDVYITGAVKHVPYFQIAVSTYDNVCTLSSNLYGTEKDSERVRNFMQSIKDDIVSNCYRQCTI